MSRGRAAWIPCVRGRPDRPRYPQRASCRRGITAKNFATQQAARRRTLVAAHQSIDRTCARLTTAKACPCPVLVSSRDDRIFTGWFPVRSLSLHRAREGGRLHLEQPSPFRLAVRAFAPVGGRPRQSPGLRLEGELEAQEKEPPFRGGSKS